MAGQAAGGRSNWMKWGLLTLAGLPLLCGGCGLMGFLYIRSESAYDAAVERATAHTQVNKVLGAPVSADFLFKGLMRSTGDDATAAMEIGMSGSKQDGVLQVKAVRTSGVWGFSTLKLVANDGTVVNVVGKY